MTGPGRSPLSGSARDRGWARRVQVPGGRPREPWEQADDDRKVSRRGIVLLAIGVVAVLLLVYASCSSSKDDAGPAPTFAPRPTTGLAARLSPPPAGSVPGTSSWARDYTPDLGAFVAHVYQAKVRGQVTDQLRQQGLREIAHVLWITRDSVQADTVLLRFAAEDGARQRLAFLEKNVDSRETRTALGGTGEPVLYVDPTPTKEGFRSATLYARVGAVVVELFVYTPTQVSQPQVERWARDQLARLA